jgi:hypothetical protein
MNPYQREILRLRELLQAERRAARTDHLTGLRNRRSLDGLAAELITGAVRDYAVLAIDVATSATTPATPRCVGWQPASATTTTPSASAATSSWSCWSGRVTPATPSRSPTASATCSA